VNRIERTVEDQTAAYQNIDFNARSPASNIELVRAIEASPSTERVMIQAAYRNLYDRSNPSQN